MAYSPTVGSQTIPRLPLHPARFATPAVLITPVLTLNRQLFFNESNGYPYMLAGLFPSSSWQAVPSFKIARNTRTYRSRSRGISR